MSTPWPPATFKIATLHGVQDRSGYAWKGLGLWLMDVGSAKGRRLPKWSLTHLGSGHAVGFIKGKVAEAFPIATEVAEAGDWSFDGLAGYKNQFPDAAERVAEILVRHGKRFSRSTGGGSHEAQAREIAIGAA